MTEVSKKRRSEAEYRRLLAERDESGLTLKAFAESKGIKPFTLYAWHRRLRGPRSSRRTMNEMVPVRVVKAEGETPPVSTDRSFEVTISDERVVSVPYGFDAGELRRLLSALEPGC